MTDYKEILKDKNNNAHAKILKTSLDLLKVSKIDMGTYYDAWDAADMAFRLKRKTDESDVNAARRKEPMKSTLPFAHPQILTFVAFCMLLFTQRETFFEIQGSGVEDGGTPERDAEKVLERDLNKNKWKSLLYQLLLDLGKFGVAITKAQWDEKKMKVPTQVVQPPGETLVGQPVEASTTEVMTEKTVYLGNRLDIVSPYHFYPDTRLPLTQFQEGEFCASEDEYSTVRLQALEASGLIIGLDDMKNLNAVRQEADTFFANTRFHSTRSVELGETKEGPGMCVVTEIQRWITPNQFFLDDEKKTPLGDENEPQLFLIWIGNWNRVIRFEPMGYLHGQFTYCTGQFNHDQHQTVNEGLAELLDPMETTASWLLNSRIASVRKNVDARMFIDPQSVEWDDVVQRKPVIRMKPTARGTVDQWFKQIAVTDVTQNHMQDIQTLWQFSQGASGISENMLGQYSAGRRDATQSRAVASGASGRMRSIATVIWDTLFTSLGEQMLTNLQDGLTIEEFRKIVGDDADEVRFAAFNKRAQGVIGSYDFNFFDGTLPSEKGFVAQSMQELFLGMIQNPQSMMMLQAEPFRSIFVEIAELRSIRNPQRFLPPVAAPNNVTQINPGTGATELSGPPQSIPSQPVV